MCYVSAENIIHAISEFCRLVHEPVRLRFDPESVQKRTGMFVKH